MTEDTRTAAQLSEHYEIERELANRLRSASREERKALYSALYDEMYRRVPLHPQLVRKNSVEETQRNLAIQMQFVKPFLRQEDSFMEIGPGDCAMSFEVTKFVRQVYAVDVSDAITRAAGHPSNFKLILSDGCNIPLPAGGLNVAYSNQLMEHLHPDDALTQLRNIYDTLRPGGLYICITPNRLTGPHDVSRGFSEIANGFHLKEYITSELVALFGEVGFENTKAYVRLKGRYLTVPIGLVVLYEKMLAMVPYSVRIAVSKRWPFSSMQNIRLIGVK